MVLLFGIAACTQGSGSPSNDFRFDRRQEGRTGTDGRLYPWGHSDENLEERVVVLRLRADPTIVWGPGRINATWPVGSRPSGKSPYGALDMLGNVWEWTADFYDAKYYTRSPRKNPRGPSAGTFRVIRGNVDPRFMRVNERARLAPDRRMGTLGFRCAKNL